MLDSPNRPRGSQRRIARKRSQSQLASQSARAAKPPANRREARRVVRSVEGHPLGSEIDARMQGQPNSPGDTRGDRSTMANRRRPKPSPRSQPSPATSQQGIGASRQDLGRQDLGRATGQPNRSRLSSRGMPAGSRQRQRSAARPERGTHPSTRTSPLVYLVRLLIVGIGVGAIAGTVISIWNPSMRLPAGSKATAPTQPTQQSRSNPPGGNLAGTQASITSVQTGREMTDLVTRVTPLVRDLTDLVPGVYLMDLDNGNFFSFNGTNTFSSASMIKLPILVAFFQDVDAGKIKLDEMLAIQQADIAEGSGEMQYAGAGTQYTALETVTNMIITSDNTATNMIIRRIGGVETINQRLRQWGMQQTLMRKLLPDLEGTNTTSPKELVSLMALVNDGKLISMKSRDRVFDIMRRTETDTLLPSIMAPGSTIAHKTGDIGSMVGDVGIVDLPSGRRYAVAAMVKRPHNDGRAQELIRKIAALAYEQFGGQPVLAPSPPAASPAVVAPAAPAAPVAPPGVPTAVPQQTLAPAYPNPLPAGSVPNSTPNAVAPEAPVAPVTPEALAPAQAEPAATPPEVAEPISTEAEPPSETTESSEAAADLAPDERASTEPY